MLNLLSIILFLKHTHGWQELWLESIIYEYYVICQLIDCRLMCSYKIHRHIKKKGSTVSNYSQRKILFALQYVFLKTNKQTIR